MNITDLLTNKDCSVNIQLYIEPEKCKDLSRCLFQNEPIDLTLSGLHCNEVSFEATSESPDNKVTIGLIKGVNIE